MNVLPFTAILKVTWKLFQHSSESIWWTEFELSGKLQNILRFAWHVCLHTRLFLFFRVSAV